MKIILTQDVPGVGDAGAIKEVADGYARNYLIPKKLAQPATRSSIKQAEAQAEVIARRADKQRQATQKTASALEGKTVRIYARTGSENRLYGSVTAADVAEAVAAQFGVTVDRRKVELAEAIHRTGTYAATADFGNSVTAAFQVEVAPEVAGAGAASASTQEAEGAGEAPGTPSASAQGEAGDEADEAAGEADGEEESLGLTPPISGAAAAEQAEASPS